MFQKLKNVSPMVLRYSMSFLFLWFGLNQLFHAGAWVAWLPSWVHSLPVTPLTFIYMNGLLETVLGLALLVGLFTRGAAFVLSLHLFGIAFSLGYNDIAVRDFCLALATLAVSFHGADKLCFDIRLKKTWWGHTSFAKFFSLYEKEE